MRAQKQASPGDLPPRAGIPTSASVVNHNPATGETTEVIGHGEIPSVKADTVKHRDGRNAGRLHIEQQTDEAPPEIARYVVMRESNPMIDGRNVRLSVGKELDNINYNIPQLVRQGVKLKAMKPGETAADHLIEN